MFRSIATIAAVFTTALTTPAVAQNLPCAPRERVLHFVIDERGEQRLATGRAQNGAQIDLFAADSGTWSLIVHLPDGRSCVLANGQGFQATQGLQPARGVPA